MVKTIILNQEINDFEITSMKWSDLNQIMLGLESAISIFERKVNDDPSDPSAKMELDSFKKLFENIARQYPTWRGEVRGLIEQNIDETLRKYKIR